MISVSYISKILLYLVFVDSKSYFKPEKQGIGDIEVWWTGLSARRKELRSSNSFNRYVFDGWRFNHRFKSNVAIGT